MDESGDEWLTAPCPLPSNAHRLLAQARQDQLTKPAGSLGRVERLAVELASLQATERPRATLAPILVFAGDHGITAQGVSAFPAEVTIQMMANFAAGGAAIAVLARELGVPLTVIDAGSRAVELVPGVITDKPRCGTRDFSAEAALQAEEVTFALGCGRRAVERATAKGADLVLLGEMGIGNTTSATAIACALASLGAEQVAGRGTGLDEAGWRTKIEIIERALRFHRLRDQPVAALAVLAAVGGLEIAALSGAIIAAGQRRTPVVVDGFIVSAAALAAVHINPSCRPWMIFSHRSAERGHHLVLEALGAEPLLDLSLRLGEGSGAALTLPLIRLACSLHNGMTTFAQAAVSQRSPSDAV